MNKKALRAVLASSLAKFRGDGESQLAFAKRLGIGQRSAGRVLAQEHSATIDLLCVIAENLGVEAWMLLVPGVDPAFPPSRDELAEVTRFVRWRAKALAEGGKGYDVESEQQEGGKHIVREYSAEQKPRAESHFQDHAGSTATRVRSHRKPSHGKK